MLEKLFAHKFIYIHPSYISINILQHPVPYPGGGGSNLSADWGRRGSSWVYPRVFFWHDISGIQKRSQSECWTTTADVSLLRTSYMTEFWHPLEEANTRQHKMCMPIGVCWISRCCRTTSRWYFTGKFQHYLEWHQVPSLNWRASSI